MTLCLDMQTLSLKSLSSLSLSFFFFFNEIQSKCLFTVIAFPAVPGRVCCSLKSVETYSTETYVMTCAMFRVESPYYVAASEPSVSSMIAKPVLFIFLYPPPSMGPGTKQGLRKSLGIM